MKKSRRKVNQQLPVKARQDRSREILGNKSLQIICLLGLPCIIYIPSFFVDWYFDDYNAILNNAYIRDVSGIKHILDSYIHRGIVQLTYAFDWIISIKLGLFSESQRIGLDIEAYPIVFHITSVVIHLLTVLFSFKYFTYLYQIIYCKEDNNSQINDDNDLDILRYAPYFAAFIFSVLTINTEAVTYLAGRSSSLATLEYVAGMSAFLLASANFGYIASPSHLLANNRKLWGAIFAALGCIFLVLGIGTKEIIVTLPFVAGLVTFIISVYQTSWRIACRRILLPAIFSFLLIVVFLAYRVAVFGNLGLVESSVRPWKTNLLSQIYIIVMYYIPRQLGISHLCLDPYIVPVLEANDPRFIISFAVLMILVMSAILLIKSKPLLSLGIVWWLVALAPTSSIVPLSDLAAERRTYLPNVGFSIFLAVSIIHVGQIIFRKYYMASNVSKPIIAIAAAFILFQSVMTVQRNLLYCDKGAFWTDTISKSSTNPRAYYNLGLFYIESGEKDKAIPVLTKASYFNDRFAINAANALSGIYMNDKKNFVQAKNWLKRCIELDPKNERYWINMGNCYLLLKDYEGAWAFSKQWLETYPGSFFAKRFKGQLLQTGGDYDEAERLYLELLDKFGDDTLVLKNLRNIALARGNNDKVSYYEDRLKNIKMRATAVPSSLKGMRMNIQINNE